MLRTNQTIFTQRIKSYGVEKSPDIICPFTQNYNVENETEKLIIDTNC